MDVATESAPADGMSDLAFLDQTLATIASTAAPVVSDAPIDETVDAPDVNASIDEEIANQTDAADAEAKPEVEAPKPAVKADAAADEDFEDGSDNLSVNNLNKHISTSPELKAALDKDPTLRKQLFYTARRAARANEYDELFQTPALAKETKTAADERFEFRQLFESDVPEDSTKFWQRLLFDSLQKNEDGRLQLQNGRPVSNGSYERVTAAYRASVYEGLESIAQSLIQAGQMHGDISGQDVQEAVRIIQTVIEGKAPTAVGGAPAPTQDDAVPSHVQAELARLRAENAEFKKTTTTTADQFRESAKVAASKAIAEDVKNLLAKRLPANAAVSDYMRDAIVNDVVKEIEKLAGSNSAHNDLVSRMLRTSSRNDDSLKKIVDFKRGFSKEILPRILSRIITQATSGVIKENKALNTKVDNQQSRREIETSGGGSPAPTRPDAKSIVRTAEEAARKSGKRVSDLDLVDAVVAAQQKR